MSENIKLDLQPGMVFFQKHQRLYFMLTTITKVELIFSKIHDTRGVITKTIAEFYEFLHDGRWVQSTLEECISLADSKVKSTKSKKQTVEQKLQELKALENYYLDLKGMGERYNKNLSNPRK